MAFFRKRGGRKTFRGRRRGRRTAYSVAKRALRAVRSVRPELQYLYTNEGSSLTPGTAGLTYHTTALAQGSGDSERKAAMIMAKSLQLNLAMVKNASATTDFVRVVIYQDKQQIADTSSGPSFTYLSPITPTDKMRYRILYDRMFALSDSTVSRHLKIVKRINAFVRYNGANATDIQKNGVYVPIVSQDNTDKADCELNWRLTYTDA